MTICSSALGERWRSRRVLRVIPLVCASVTVTAPAFAYIDPNAGGLLYQILAPLLIMLATGYAFLKSRIADIYRRLVLWLFEKKLAG